MTDPKELLGEFQTKAIKMICPHWKQCLKSGCDHIHPHNKEYSCDISCTFAGSECIQIPEVYPSWVKK